MDLIIGAGLLWALIYFLARQLPGSRLYNLSHRGAVLILIIAGGGGLLLRQCKERRRADQFQERMLELQHRVELLRAGGDAEGDAEGDSGIEQEREPSGDRTQRRR